MRKLNSTASNKGTFALPTDSRTAAQICYGLMTSGLLFTPLVMFIYGRFIAPKIGMSTKEFFIIFTAAFMLSLIFVSSASVRTSSALRKKMDIKLPRDFAIVASTAANSNVPDIVELGRKYWFWQLVHGYFVGIGFSWIFCVFALFIF